MKPATKTITDAWITEHDPCQSALDWWNKKERDPIKILRLLIRTKKLDWANWFIVRVMTYHDYVSYAVFAAEQTIGIYEKRYPGDKRPRQMIEAARRCIKDPSKENKKAALSYTYTYTYTCAYAAANAAAYAADATYAANAAYAAYATYAANAAYATYAAAAAAKNKMKLKILKYGMKLLTQEAL